MHGRTTPREAPITYDDPEIRAQREERMFRVTASHEAAVALRNALAAYTDGRIWTNRYPHTDHFHIELDQLAAAQLVQVLTATTEGNAPVTTHSTTQDDQAAAEAAEERYRLLAAVVDGLKRLK